MLNEPFVSQAQPRDTVFQPVPRREEPRPAAPARPRVPTRKAPLSRAQFQAWKDPFLIFLSWMAILLSGSTTILSATWVEDKLRSVGQPASEVGRWSAYGVILGIIFFGVLLLGQWIFSSDGPLWAYLYFVAPDAFMTFAQIMTWVTLPLVLSIAPGNLYALYGSTAITAGVSIVSSIAPEKLLFGPRGR